MEVRETDLDNVCRYYVIAERNLSMRVGVRIISGATLHCEKATRQ